MDTKVCFSGAKFSIDELIERIVGYEPLLNRYRAREIAYSIESKVNESLPASYRLSLDSDCITSKVGETEDLSEKEFDLILDEAFYELMRDE